MVGDAATHSLAGHVHRSGDTIETANRAMFEYRVATMGIPWTHELFATDATCFVDRGCLGTRTRCLLSSQRPPPADVNMTPPRRHDTPTRARFDRSRFLENNTVCNKPLLIFIISYLKFTKIILERINFTVKVLMGTHTFNVESPFYNGDSRGPRVTKGYYRLLFQ